MATSPNMLSFFVVPCLNADAFWGGEKNLLADQTPLANACKAYWNPDVGRLAREGVLATYGIYIDLRWGAVRGQCMQMECLGLPHLCQAQRSTRRSPVPSMAAGTAGLDSCQ